MPELSTPTVAALLTTATDLLRRGGVETPRRDGRILLRHVTGLDDAAIVGYPQTPVSADAAQVLESLVARRVAGEPLSRVLERREFWSLDFRLSAETLDPRPDSETLVEAVLDRVPDRGAPLRLLDLGTGTGCLLLALLSELPRAFGLGVDISPGACSAAAANARALGLAGRAAFVVSNWCSALCGRFDVVLSNPPYIPTAEIDGLDRGVRLFDPRLALSGGADGLDAYRAIVPDLGRLLRPEGFAALELGAGQETGVATILSREGLVVRCLRRDLAGINRCMVAEMAIV